MDPRQAASQLESWRSSLLASVHPVLLDTRAQLVEAQSRPEADEAIGRIEELARATLEPVFLRAEMTLERVQQAYSGWIDSQEEVSDAHSELQSTLGDAPGAIRDWTDRKLASLVAQARAQELLPSAQPPSQTSQEPSRRFCTRCGAPTVEPRQVRCGQCGSAL